MVAQDSPSSEDLDDSICDIWTAKLRERKIWENTL